MDFQARAILNQEAAAIRNQGKEPDARTVWLRLMDRTAEEGGDVLGTASPLGFYLRQGFEEVGQTTPRGEWLLRRPL